MSEFMSAFTSESTRTISSTAPRQRLILMGTATVAGFALTLLGASLLVLINRAPVAIPAGQRVDLAAFLFLMPLLALSLALVVEVARLALRREPLPEIARPVAIDWLGTSARD